LAEGILASKRALITGGSSGMGEEIARQMAAAGAEVTVVGRSQDRLERVVGSIERHGGRGHLIV